MSLNDNKNNLSDITLLGSRSKNSLENSEVKIINNSKNNENKFKKNNFLERKRSTALSNEDNKLSMSFTKELKTLKIPNSFEIGQIKNKENKNKLV